METKEYIDIIRDVMKKNGDYSAEYFEGHLPRFEAQIDMFREHLDKEAIERVYDLGTSVPFTSYYFNVTKNAEVLYGCVDVTVEKDIAPRVHRFYLNLNAPKKMEQADLVICTECLEHLPSNLYRVRQALSDYVKDGKYLLLSFPLNGMNAKDYHLELSMDNNKCHGHLREFNEKTARDFYIVSGFKMISEKITWTNAYGGKIMNVLLKKDIYT